MKSFDSLRFQLSMKRNRLFRRKEQKMNERVGEKDLDRTVFVKERNEFLQKRTNTNRNIIKKYQRNDRVFVGVGVEQPKVGKKVINILTCRAVRKITTTT